MRPVIRVLPALVATLLALTGCGGDDEGDEAPAPPATATTTGTTTATERADPPETDAEPRYERTPRSLVRCLEQADGVEDALVKGPESEDATFFSELAGARVDVLAVTLEGQPAEVTVALFASAADARKVAPDAGGGGVEATPLGSALVGAPPDSDTGAVEDCLRATGYA